MKLKRLRVSGFGPLRGDYSFDPDRLTMLVDENERGKSSLLAAITAALYGLEDDRRSHRMLTPTERWRPWQGGPYGLQLEFESDGEMFTVKRDFDRGTVEVWNGRGQEVTAEFLQGKDQYPVGRKLLGLDVQEFEKCALVRQGELDQVVPADEKARRASTLHARLENAADTRVGDTNASEALQVLENAARRYDCVELETTVTVENAIKGLEAKLGLIETDLKTLEHDLDQVRGPLEELTRLGEDEKQARDALGRLDAERRRSMAGEVKRQLKAHEEQNAGLEKLRREAETLRGVAHLPADSEAKFREAVARYEVAQRNLDGLEARRREEQSRERGALEAEVEGLKAYASCAAEDADRLVALAAEMRRIADEDSRLRTEVFAQRDSLASKGYEPERKKALQSRLGRLSDEEQRLLRGQSELALAFQTEVARLEQARTESTELLRTIDALRHGRRLPGWFLVALGLGAAVAGGVMVGIHAPGSLSSLLLGGGVALIAVGGLMVGAAARTRSEDRESALRRLTDAQRRLTQLRSQRAETEVGLAEVSRALGYRDPVELMREWNEFSRLTEESAPVDRADEQIRTLDSQRRRTLDDVRAMLDRVGGGSPDPAHLEYIALGIRRLHAARQRLTELERSWSWIDEEKRSVEAEAKGLKEGAIRILQSAGLTYDPSRPWSSHVTELAERVREKSRYATLVEQLIPQAERQMRPPHEIEALQGQLQLIEAEGAAAGGEAGLGARTPLEIENENKRVHATLDALQKRREDLRLQVEEAWRRHHAEHPEKLAQKERIERALTRARRYKRAVEMARDTIQKVALETHRRWAEHLNHRVGELLASVGTRVEELRFGEDLDFSVKLWEGQQVSRGKAVLQLSSGARDQLHLAVRLAICEYLSRGQAPLPLLIDDAFASSDDERARAGMKLLLEHFSKRHQIVMVTCHRRRYEALASLDPELYANRVRWLDVRPAFITPARDADHE